MFSLMSYAQRHSSSISSASERTVRTSVQSCGFTHVHVSGSIGAFVEHAALKVKGQISSDISSLFY